MLRIVPVGLVSAGLAGTQSSRTGIKLRLTKKTHARLLAGTSLAALLALANCAFCASTSEGLVVKAVTDAFQAGRVDEAIGLAEPLARSSDPELVFSVAYLYLARTQVEGRTEAQRQADSDQFLRQVERAARAGLDEAPRLLEAVFRYGGYGTISTSRIQADCWRAVIEHRAAADRCAQHNQ